MNQDDLMELAMMALAAGAGAVDETSFGLAEKVIPGVDKLKKENPNSFAAGQVGSYFIPGTGVVGLGGRVLGKLGGKAVVRAAKAAQGPLEGILAKMAKGALRSGATGAIEAGGQTAIRNALGTSGQGDVADNAKTGGALGALIGGLSPGLGGAASRIYSHPTIFNTKDPKARELMQKLMDEGVVGGENTFRRYAEKAKGEYGKIMDPMKKKIAGIRVPIDDVVGAGDESAGSFAERMWNKKTTGQTAATEQFKKTLEGAKTRLGDNPKMSELDELLTVANKELSGLKPQKRAEAITGVGGTASNADEAIGALKATIERTQGKQIGKKMGQEGTEKIGKAKERWGTGRSLERSLDRPESLAQAIKGSLPIPAAAGGLGALTAGTVGLPALAGGLIVAGGTAAARSLPGRTALGVGANKLAKNPGKTAALAGRATEFANRDEPAYRIKDGEVEETPTGYKARTGKNPFLDEEGLEEKPKKKDQPKGKRDNRIVQEREENIFLEGLGL